MNLAGLRYWQWILIGLVIGAAVGWAWTGAPSTQLRSGDPDIFNGNVQRIAGGATPQIRNVTVFAPETDPSGNAVYPVTYERFVPDNKGGGSFETEMINAKTPFTIGTARPWLNQYPAKAASVMEYLTKNHVPFTNRTGNAQYTPIAYGAMAGVLLIGLIWPTTIRLLVNAGLATPPPPREKRVKEKAKTRITPENDGSIKSGPRGITSADVGSLNALNDDMEKRLADGLSAGEGRPATAAVASEPVSIFMSGGGSRGSTDPTEAAAVVATEDEKKDYKGEWYPVARPIVKKDGEH